ncbi:uncharacterized protein [Amphiura filiformis]|uniref:uncharacterized protein n=1 Tax=Amphiura filiformis TaxID=82378 RepID=UPI003B21A272
MGQRLLSVNMPSRMKFLMLCIFWIVSVIGFSMLFSRHLNCQPDHRSSLKEIQLEDRHLLSTIDNRPLLVLGILSAHSEYRNAQRSTWLSTIHVLQDKLPFRVIYKFLIDQPTNDTIVENDKYNDILVLNTTYHGYAVKFGYKIYLWLKYVYENYPDTLLVAKLDDDVFLCVPQLLKRLNELKSTKLYYGWAFEKPKRMDAMFVLVGKGLLERIAKRKYCAERCNVTIDLIDNDWDGLSVGSWLSIYDDVDFQADNNRIIHILRSANFETRILKNIKPGFCSKYVINHKSSIQVMRQLHEYNRPVSDQVFGEVVRKPLPMPSLTTHHIFQKR